MNYLQGCYFLIFFAINFIGTFLLLSAYPQIFEKLKWFLEVLPDYIMAVCAIYVARFGLQQWQEYIARESFKEISDIINNFVTDVCAIRDMPISVDQHCLVNPIPTQKKLDAKIKEYLLKLQTALKFLNDNNMEKSTIAKKYCAREIRTAIALPKVLDIYKAFDSITTLKGIVNAWGININKVISKDKVPPLIQSIYQDLLKANIEFAREPPLTNPPK